mgnify:CR=1 FL=1
MEKQVVLNASKLFNFISISLNKMGCNQKEADRIANSLIGANLRGHDSHGVGIIPTYLNNLKKELLIPNTPVTIIKDDGAFLQFDGGKGYGQRVAEEAMKKGITRCKEIGLVVMTLKNAHHIGRVGTYGEMAVDENLVSEIDYVVIDGKKQTIKDLKSKWY